MKIIKLKKQGINLKEYIKRGASENDADILIDYDTVIVDEDTNEVILIYKKLENKEIHEKIRKGLKDLSYISSQRLSGLKNTGGTKIFGYVPRTPFKPTDSACRISKLAKEKPETHKDICDYAKYINDIYKDNNEERFNRHLELTKKVNHNYVIPDTLFTSGIININNPLKYHYDGGNFKGVCSAMIAFKENIQGGYLSIPEYNIKLEICDKSVSLFDGQALLHGVTPIKKLTDDATRYTIVFYSLVNMWSCLPLDEEILRAREMRWKSEFNKFMNKKNAFKKD